MRILLSILISLNHRGVVKCICRSWLKVEIAQQIVFYAEVKSALHILVGGVEIVNELKHLALYSLPMLLPYLTSHDIRNLCHKDCTRVYKPLL